MSLLLNAAALLILGSGPALAQERWAIFIDDAAANTSPCVSAADLASGVSATTGATLSVLPELPSPPPLGVEHVVVGRVSRQSEQVTLTLALRDASGVQVGERVLERPQAQCSALRDAAVLAIAVMMGKGLAPLDAAPIESAAAGAASAPEEPPPPEPTPAPVAPAQPVPSAAREPKRPTSPSTRAREPLELQLFAGAGAAANVVPGLTPHALIGARLGDALPWPLELSAAFLGTSEAELGGASNGRARFSPFYGVLTACPFSGSIGALHADACLGLLAGVALTSATDFTLRNRKGTQPLVGALVRLPITLRLGGPFLLRASASVGTPLVYSRVYAIDSELRRRKLTQTSALFASLDLAIGLELF